MEPEATLEEFLRSDEFLSRPIEVFSGEVIPDIGATFVEAGG
jgi:hypothetical protein